MTQWPILWHSHTPMCFYTVVGLPPQKTTQTQFMSQLKIFMPASWWLHLVIRDARCWHFIWGTEVESPQSVCSPCHNTTCLFCYFCDPGPWACQASVLRWAPPQPHSVPHVIGISCFEEPEFLTFVFWCHMTLIIFSVPWHLISPSSCLFPQTALWQACGAPFTCQALCSCSCVDNSSIPSYLTSSIYRAQSTFWL